MLKLDIQKLKLWILLIDAEGSSSLVDKYIELVVENEVKELYNCVNLYFYKDYTLS